MGGGLCFSFTTVPQAEYLRYFPDFSRLRGHLLQLSHYKRHGFREVVSGLRCMLPVGRTDWSLNIISAKAPSQDRCDDSAGKGVRRQAYQPEFRPWNCLVRGKNGFSHVHGGMHV